MRELPIIFSGPMVRAILDGKKTMTRRVIKDLNPAWKPNIAMEGVWQQRHEDGLIYLAIKEQTDVDSSIIRYIPAKYQIGDILWVKETWAKIAFPYEYIKYKADEPHPSGEWGKWESPRFMTKSASRIRLEVTNIKVERLQEITESDAILEGFTSYPTESAIGGFFAIWEKLHGKDYPWDSNPFCWVISFRRIS